MNTFDTTRTGRSCRLAAVAGALSLTLGACAITPRDPLLAAAAEPGAMTIRGGIIYRETQSGWGASPRYDDKVHVKYRGYFPDGREFDKSSEGGNDFFVNRVIICWTQAVQQMKVGAKATITCPSTTAYGDKGAGTQIPPNSTLRFDVELVSIVSQ